MFELFPDQPVYEFPTFVNVAYAMLWSAVLSSLIGITHKVTNRAITYPNNFFQALILGSIVTTIVMMAIGDSLARGLGVFGAMAIIRFRTIITDPRDVLFLFASLSVGLAVGVFGFTIGFVGTIMFCVIALGLNLSAFRAKATRMRLNFTLDNIDDLNEVMDLLRSYCDFLINTSVSTSTTVEDVTRVKYQFVFTLKPNVTEHDLMNGLLQVDKISQTKISLEEEIK